VVGNRQGETEKADDRADQAFRLAQSETEHRPQRQRRQDRSGEYYACPPRVVRGAARQPAIASSVIGSRTGAPAGMPVETTVKVAGPD